MGAVAKKTEAGLPAEMMDDLLKDSGMGMENASADDMIIPFLKMAQSLTDETKKSKPTYIPGLEEGKFFNSATQKVYGESVNIIPCLYEKQFLEFVPRANGGGFRGQHDETIMQQTSEGPKGEAFLPDGNEIIKCGVWYVLVEDPDTGNWTSAVMSLAKSQFKRSRMLMTQLKSLSIEHPKGGRFNPPMFYNVVQVKGLPTSNDQGDWMLWDFTIQGNVFDLDNGTEIYGQAKRLIEAVNSGAARAAEPTADMGGGGDEEIPF